jgi:hypothetical protein
MVETTIIIEQTKRFIKVDSFIFHFFSAVSRYKITHPVINDQNYEMWNSYSIICWPTLVLINPIVS